MPDVAIFDASALAGFGFRTRDFIDAPTTQGTICTEALQAYGYGPKAPRGAANSNVRPSPPAA
jgi:hypothetical protein